MPLPLSTLRALALRAPPDAPAVVFCSSPPLTLSYAQLADRAQAVGGLLANKLPAQTVVAMVMGNTPDFVAAFLGITAFAVCVALPMNPTTSREEALSTFTDANVKILLTDDAKSAAKIVADEMKIEVIIITPDFIAKLLSGGKKASDGTRVPAPHDRALYLFTSGTTAKPKLVPLTHHNMITSIGNIRNTYQLDERDRTYQVMPLFHIHGLQSAMGGTLASGGTIILPAAGKFSANVFWSDVVAHGATWYTAVPTIHQILLARADQDRELIAKTRLRFIRSCSASLAPATLERLEALTKTTVLEAYAMSEAAHQMTSNPLPMHGPRKPGSVGRATNVQLSIRNADLKDVVAQAGVIGEVCIRGENVMDGYLNRPEANKEAFAEGGWFRTGDFGYLDKDGYLFLTGRLKEIVNRGGEKISPAEIDSVLLDHPLVAEAVAFGLPSEKYGEELACVVVPNPGARLVPEDIVKYLQGRVSKEKVPALSSVFIVDTIPKSSIGKVQRRNLTTHFDQLRKKNSKL